MYSSSKSMAAAAVLLVLAAASSLTVSSCRTGSGGTDTFIPAVPDWSNAAAWYISQPSGDNAPAADIFYILPTCIWDWTTADGQTCRYSDYTRTDHIEAFLPSVKLAEDIFAHGQYGFYCPYYRQISLNVWMDGEAAVEELFPLSMEDVSAAFDYYLDNYNEGRPFVLATSPPRPMNGWSPPTPSATASRMRSWRNTLSCAPPSTRPAPAPSSATTP